MNHQQEKSAARALVMCACHVRICVCAAGNLYLSSKEQIQFDCAEERVRLLALSLFSGNMGSGNVVHTDSYETKWELIQPRSINRVMWKFACTKQ